MKKVYFNKAEDVRINELVKAMNRGDVEASEEFGIVIDKVMEQKARTTFMGQMTKEDVKQEFILKAIEVAPKWDEKKYPKFMSYLWTAINNLQKDNIDYDNAQKRAKTFELNGETYSRELSLQTPVGDDGEATMADKIAADYVSVSEQAINKVENDRMKLVVKDFVSSTKGRNGEIMAVVYDGMERGLTDNEINAELAVLLGKDMTVKKDQNAVRTAKRRAIKAFGEFYKARLK